MGERWMLQADGGPEREVTKAEWIATESAAGFHGGGGIEPSTHSWSANGMRGWRERPLVAGDRLQLRARGSIPSRHATLSMPSED